MIGYAGFFCLELFHEVRWHREHIGATLAHVAVFFAFASAGLPPSLERSFEEG